jgi:hypothetical protein
MESARSERETHPAKFLKWASQSPQNLIPRAPHPLHHVISSRPVFVSVLSHPLARAFPYSLDRNFQIPQVWPTTHERRTYPILRCNNTLLPTSMTTSVTLRRQAYVRMSVRYDQANELVYGTPCRNDLLTPTVVTNVRLSRGDCCAGGGRPHCIHVVS